MTELTKQGFEYRDSDHSYFMDGKRMTGVTTILGVLSKPMLIPWAARMAAEYIDGFIKEVAVHADWQAMLQDGKWAEVVEDAKKAHAKKRDEGAQKGTDTHALVEEWIKFLISTNGGKQPDHVQGDKKWEAIAPFMEWAVRENITFLASEAKMYSKSLFIAGTADFIFEKDGKRYVGDIKTFKKIWDRTPFYQCAGYALMWEEMNYDSRENPEIAGYVIFNLPKEREWKEDEDVLWSFDVEGDTKAFMACVEIYRQNANFKPNYSKKTK